MLDQLPGSLVDKTGTLHSTQQVLKEKKVLAFYFSAHWCPPCRQFTPVLARSYEQARQAGLGTGVEIIFVSSDRSEQEMRSYLGESHGNWYALPHGSGEGQTLSGQFGVRGIPALVVVARDGTVISKDGRQEISSLGQNNYTVLTTARNLNTFRNVRLLSVGVFSPGRGRHLSRQHVEG